MNIARVKNIYLRVYTVFFISSLVGSCAIVYMYIEIIIVFFFTQRNSNSNFTTFGKNKMSTGSSRIIPEQKLNLDVTHIANAPRVGKSLTSLPHNHPSGEHTLVLK